MRATRKINKNRVCYVNDSLMKLFIILECAIKSFTKTKNRKPVHCLQTSIFHKINHYNILSMWNQFFAIVFFCLKMLKILKFLKIWKILENIKKKILCTCHTQTKKQQHNIIHIWHINDIIYDIRQRYTHYQIIISDIVIRY